MIHVGSTHGQAQFVANLGEAFAAACADAGVQHPSIASMACGLSTVPDGSREADIVAGLVRQVLAPARLSVVSDSATALAGAFRRGPGIVAISGTGSVVLGRNIAGGQHRAGGWGWLVGDEGSAVAIGRAGLRAACAHADQSGPRTKLHDLMLAHFGITDLNDAKRIVYAPEFAAKGFASLAPLVSSAAEQDDDAAFEIIRGDGVMLAGQVIAVARRLKLTPTDTRVAPLGGGFAYIYGLRAAFAHAFAMIQPDVQVVEPDADALQGAVWMAM